MQGLCIGKSSIQQAHLWNARQLLILAKLRTTIVMIIIIIIIIIIIKTVMALTETSTSRV